MKGTASLTRTLLVLVFRQKTVPVDRKCFLRLWSIVWVQGGVNSEEL